MTHPTDEREEWFPLPTPHDDPTLPPVWSGAFGPCICADCQRKRHASEPLAHPTDEREAVCANDVPTSLVHEADGLLSLVAYRYRRADIPDDLRDELIACSLKFRRIGEERKRAATPPTASAPPFANAIAHLPHDEQVRLQATVAEQARTLPERVTEVALIRALTKVLGSPFLCEMHNCQKFMPPDDMPGPSCDWRTATVAECETVTQSFRPVCPLCEPERALATIHHTYPETRP